VSGGGQLAAIVTLTPPSAQRHCSTPRLIRQALLTHSHSPVTGWLCWCPNIPSSHFPTLTVSSDCDQGAPLKKTSSQYGQRGVERAEVVYVVSTIHSTVSAAQAQHTLLARPTSRVLPA
jgi:hypothetical protein